MGVEPARDGRGREPESKPPLFPRGRFWIALLLGLLVVNMLLSFSTGGPQSRTQVPYQPFFVDELEAGNVEQIVSRADSIQGELREEATYDPPGAAEPVQVTRFKTQVPASSTATGSRACSATRTSSSTRSRPMRAARSWRACCSASAQRCSSSASSSGSCAAR